MMGRRGGYFVYIRRANVCLCDQSGMNVILALAVLFRLSFPAGSPTTPTPALPIKLTVGAEPHYVTVIKFITTRSKIKSEIKWVDVIGKTRVRDVLIFPPYSVQPSLLPSLRYNTFRTTTFFLVGECVPLMNIQISLDVRDVEP